MSLNQPNLEELDKQIEQAASLESEKDTDKKALEGHEDTNDGGQKSDEKEVENDEDQKAAESKEKQSEEDDEVKKQDPEYKKKFIESSRENQVLAAKLKKQTEALDESTTVPEPTEEELKAEHPEWDKLSEFEKRMARKELHNDKKFAVLNRIAKENKDIDSWQGKVTTFIEDPKTLIANPKLEGKEDEFRLFANKPTRRNIDFEDLVSAFLYEESSARPKNKGKMFPSSTAADKKQAASAGKISIEDSQKLMKTNYSEYKRLLLAGKIDNQV